MNSPAIIYKIMSKDAWLAAKNDGVFAGAAIDIADGFIHFSSAEQVRETAAKHFSKQHDLMLVAVDTTQLGTDLRWEKSRNDDLFPHLYARLNIDAVVWAKPMPLDADGVHQISLEE